MLRSRAARTAVAVALTLVGLALLAWQFRTIDLTDLRHNLALLTIPGFLVVVAAGFMRFVLRSAAWRSLMDERVPLADVTAATIAGDALGNVQPLSLLVSEPAKVMYLRTPVVFERALAALLAETALYTMSIAVFIVTGILAGLTVFPLPDAVRLLSTVALVLSVSGLIVAFWIIWRQPAVVSGAASRVPSRRLRALVERIRAFEKTTYEFARQRPGKLGVLIACDAAFHLTSFLESYFTLYMLTGRSLPAEALVFDTLNRVINVVFKAVPFKIGVDEVSAGRLAMALGLPEAVGVSIGLIRKGRVIVWAAVGLPMMARRAASRRRADGPMTR